MATGIGNTGYPMSIPGSTDVAAPPVNNYSGGGLDPAYQTYLDSQIKTGNDPIPKSNYVPIQYNPSDFQVPNLSDIVAKVYNDPKLVAYYTKLLNEAQGNANLAIQRLSQDYTTGTRYNVQDTTISAQRTGEDLQSSLEKLGLTFNQEKEGALDTLNKRGIALTESPGSLAQGKTNVAQEGRAGTEMAMLSEDQALRKEAVQRTADRSMQDIGIKSQRTQEGLTQTQQRGTEDTNIKLTQTEENLQKQREQDALQQGGIIQQQQIAQQQADLQKAQIDQQNKMMQIGSTQTKA